MSSPSHLSTLLKQTASAPLTVAVTVARLVVVCRIVVVRGGRVIVDSIVLSAVRVSSTVRVSLTVRYTVGPSIVWVAVGSGSRIVTVGRSVTVVVGVPLVRVDAPSTAPIARDMMTAAARALPLNLKVSSHALRVHPLYGP